MPSPVFYDDFRLLQSRKEFYIKQFVSQLAVEAFTIAVFPGAARFYILGLDSQTRQPFFQGTRDEFWTVVRSDIVRNAVLKEQIRKNMHYLL